MNEESPFFNWQYLVYLNVHIVKVLSHDSLDKFLIKSLTDEVCHAVPAVPSPCQVGGDVLSDAASSHARPPGWTM